MRKIVNKQLLTRRLSPAFVLLYNSHSTYTGLLLDQHTYYCDLGCRVLDFGRGQNNRLYDVRLQSSVLKIEPKKPNIVLHKKILQKSISEAVCLLARLEYLTLDGRDIKLQTVNQGWWKGLKTFEVRTI